MGCGDVWFMSVNDFWRWFIEMKWFLKVIRWRKMVFEGKLFKLNGFWSGLLKMVRENETVLRSGSLKLKVLEIGSRKLNGSWRWFVTVKWIFKVISMFRGKNFHERGFLSRLVDKIVYTITFFKRNWNVLSSFFAFFLIPIFTH